MIQALACKAQTGPNILFFQVGELFKDLLRSQPIGQKLQDIGDADSQPADARPSTTLF